MSDAALSAAKAAAAIMAMNNIYYRFVHLASATDYAGPCRLRLRMNVIANPGVEALDFELWSLAVSAINGCGMCIDSHEREIVKKGASREGGQGHRPHRLGDPCRGGHARRRNAGSRPLSAAA